MATILVTGAAKGIGKACVIRLARAGHRVFAGVRKAEDGQVLAGEVPGIVPVILEITNNEQVTALRGTLEKELGSSGLDGVVNNAGIAVAGPLEFLPLDALRTQLEINVIGQIAVTQAVLPLIRRARGRIVNIGSVSGRSALPMTGPYAASKFAMEALTDALRVELKPWGIEVVIIEPGVIATPIWETSIAAAQKLSGAMPQQALEYYGRIIEGVTKRAVSGTARGLPPDRVAQAVEHALFAKKPRTRYVVGRDARARLLLERLPDRARDAIIARKLEKI